MSRTDGSGIAQGPFRLALMALGELRRALAEGSLSKARIWAEELAQVLMTFEGTVGVFTPLAPFELATLAEIPRPSGAELAALLNEVATAEPIGRDRALHRGGGDRK